MNAVLTSDAPVTLLGGAPVAGADLREALALAPRLVAADGGADAALAAGLTPEAVIGDMDSLSPEAAAAYADRLHPVAEQESTDFDKALSRLSAPLVLGLGFSGARLDHELAAIHTLLARPDRPCVLVGPVTLSVLAPPQLALPLAPGTVVSLFPFAPVRARSTGLAWPTDHLLFDPIGRVGTSNAATGAVTLAPDAPRLLVILPRATLPLVVGPLLAAPRWPPVARGG
jgi:thiamine pyrophosphokinase